MDDAGQRLEERRLDIRYIVGYPVGVAVHDLTRYQHVLAVGAQHHVLEQVEAQVLGAPQAICAVATGGRRHRNDPIAYPAGPAAWSIEIEGLSYSYPGSKRPALSDLSLRVDPGQHVAIVGPNGAGKSTLLLHVNGILLPARGSVRIGDRPSRDLIDDGDLLRRHGLELARWLHEEAP